jgi:glycine oxidase
MNLDVIVVGGGIAGVTVAWRLGQRGCKVRLLERRGFGAEASGGLAGLLTTAADGHERGAYAELSRAGLDVARGRRDRSRDGH